MDKLIEFIFVWILTLPWTITENSKYKIVRIIGLLICIPYTVILSAPMIILLVPLFIIQIIIDI